MPKNKTDRREDYLLYATLAWEKSQVKKVLTKVYLPVKKTESITLEFYPTKTQARILQHVPIFSVKARLKSLNSDVTQIEASQVFSSGVSTAYWGPKIEEHTLSGEPIDLTVSHFHTGGEYIPANICAGSFWLTPCSLLNPAAMIGHHQTGKVNVRTVWKIDFKLDSDRKLAFRRHYRIRRDTEGEEISFSELAAEFKFGAKTGKIQKVHMMLAELENVLRITSFAAQGRCVCVGWDLTSGNKHMSHYRRNVNIPPEVKRVREEGLVELINFPKFLRITYRRFLNSTFKESLARAIDYAIPRETSTLEGSFITFYAALETLVLGFRRERELQFILPSAQWKHIQKDLKQYLSKLPPFEANRLKRQMIAEKLPELNRISFATAFGEFCKSYNVDLADLWPVVGDSAGVTLTSIRNKLVHGVVFSKSDYSALMVANEHLRWTADRMILAALGWQSSESRVSRKYLSYFNAYKEWTEERKSLSR